MRRSGARVFSVALSRSGPRCTDGTAFGVIYAQGVLTGGGAVDSVEHADARIAVLDRFTYRLAGGVERAAPRTGSSSSSATLPTAVCHRRHPAAHRVWLVAALFPPGRRLDRDHRLVVDRARGFIARSSSRVALVSCASASRSLRASVGDLGAAMTRRLSGEGDDSLLQKAQGRGRGPGLLLQVGKGHGAFRAVLEVAVWIVPSVSWVRSWPVPIIKG